MLEKVFASRGTPAIIRSDNGREFIAATVVDWLEDHGVTAAFIAKASPQQNCSVECFNGTTRDELLNGELFTTLLEARVVISEWITGYNSSRPHRAPRGMSAFAEPTLARLERAASALRGMSACTANHQMLREVAAGVADSALRRTVFTGEYVAPALLGSKDGKSRGQGVAL